MTNEEVSGIGIYNKNLFSELKKCNEIDLVPVLKASRYSKAKIVAAHLQHKVKILPPLILSKEILYHGTDHRLNAYSRGPRVVTIHDMQPFVGLWLDPKFAAKRVELMTKVLKSEVQKIIAISEFTKNEILKFFPTLEKKIEVVYHGHEFQFKTESQLNELNKKNTVDNLVKGRPFLFFIGNLEERKNLINQIKAFELLKKEIPDLVFLLAGKKGFHYEKIEAAISQSPHHKDILLSGYLTESEKQYAFEKTKCLMFASFYEGFGIPAIEALSINAPLIISKASALEEIAGEFAYSVEANSPEDISQVVKKVIEFGNKKKIDQKLWSQKFTWNACALKTLEVYRKSYM